MGLSNWPTIVDDDGSLTLGTVFAKAVTDAIRASIEADMFSAVNPTVTAENVIDEVVAARGSKASLDARLDVALNEDGTLKTQASLVTQTDASSVDNKNCLVNDNFLIWAGGDAVAPTSWSLAGTGAACARSGTGLGDTTTKIGDFSAKLTYGSTTLTLTNNFLPTAAFTRFVAIRGKVIGFGAWVKSSVASQARVWVTDGVSTTYSSYHTGDGTWQWLSNVHTISNTGTLLSFGINVESSAGNPAYLSGAMAILSNLAPTQYVPTITLNSTLCWAAPGGQSAGALKGWYQFNRPAIVNYIQATLNTAPTGATTFKIDINKGSAATSLLNSVLAFVASDKAAGKAPDGTYAYRCFAGGNLATGAAVTDQLQYDIDAVGNTIGGSDLMVAVRFTEYVHPFNAFLEP
jgi:hypothetical protein